MLGQTAVAAASATILAPGSWIFGIPYAGVRAAVAFVLGCIPFFGSFVSEAFTVLLGLAGGGITKALLALGVVLLVELVESNVLQPLLIRRGVHLHPLIVLLHRRGGRSHRRDPRPLPRRPDRRHRPRGAPNLRDAGSFGELSASPDELPDAGAEGAVGTT